MILDIVGNMFIGLSCETVSASVVFGSGVTIDVFHLEGNCPVSRE